MRVRVIEERCQGHVMCVLACPELFETRDEDGHAMVLSEEVPQALEAKVLLARASCPEQAIEVE